MWLHVSNISLICYLWIFHVSRVILMIVKMFFVGFYFFFFFCMNWSKAKIHSHSVFCRFKNKFFFLRIIVFHVYECAFVFSYIFLVVYWLTSHAFYLLNNDDLIEILFLNMPVDVIVVVVSFLIWWINFVVFFFYFVD